MEYVKFPSSVEVVSYDSAGVLSNTETDAIVLDDDDSIAETVKAPANTQATLYINFTKGSLTNAIIRFYGSPLKNATDWYQETQEVDSNGTATLYPFNITLTADTKAIYNFPIDAVRSYKITVQGTGTTTGSRIKLSLGLRNN